MMADVMDLMNKYGLLAALICLVLWSIGAFLIRLGETGGKPKRKRKNKPPEIVMMDFDPDDDTIIYKDER